MNELRFIFQDETLCALPSGALFWPAEQLLVVSDLHLGKSTRAARFGGAQLPPYETQETLTRLASDLQATAARKVICLGDSFDTLDVQNALPRGDQLTLTALQAGLDWVWIEGNHDPGPIELGGRHLAQTTLGPLHFQHIAQSDARAGEVSGHYHPKATLALRGRNLTRPCFLVDQTRLMMPAYGVYTGGLACTHPALSSLMALDAEAILTGPRPSRFPMPRATPLSDTRTRDPVAR